MICATLIVVNVCQTELNNRDDLQQKRKVTCLQIYSELNWAQKLREIKGDMRFAREQSRNQFTELSKPIKFKYGYHRMTTT